VKVSFGTPYCRSLSKVLQSCCLTNGNIQEKFSVFENVTQDPIGPILFIPSIFITHFETKISLKSDFQILTRGPFDGALSLTLIE